MENALPHTAAPKQAISAGNSTAKKASKPLRVRRGRPSEIRLNNRFRLFAMTASPYLRRTFPAWIKAAMEHLASWKNPYAITAWENCANIFGEILAAGVKNEAVDAVHPVLPFDIASAEMMLAPETLTGEAAMAICFDLLHTNILPLWINRAMEALKTDHENHHLVWTKYAQITQAMKRSYMPMRAAVAPLEDPPPDHDDEALSLAERTNARRAMECN